MLPHLVRLSGASEIIPPRLYHVKGFFIKIYESTRIIHQPLDRFWRPSRYAHLS